MLTTTELEKQAKAASTLINLRFIWLLISELTELSLHAFPDVKDLFSSVEESRGFSKQSPPTFLAPLSAGHEEGVT